MVEIILYTKMGETTPEELITEHFIKLVKGIILHKVECSKDS